MKKLTILSLLCFVFFSCRKDPNLTSTSNFNPPVIDLSNFNPEIEAVIASVAGLVSDEAGKPLSGVQVALNDFISNVSNTTTDENGAFVFNQIPMNAAGTYILVKKQGFFNGSTRFFPKEGSLNYTRIKLLAKNIIGTLSSSSGGEVVGESGNKISFPPNSVITSTGEIYNGNVTVAARWIDPTAVNLPEIMPGDLQGVNSDYEEMALVTYGMTAIELTGTNGEELNLGNGQQAEVTFYLPPEMREDAPSEIPLWSFNEEFGLWQEEGIAVFDDFKYVGQVSHFSFWNCDAPFPLIYISGKIVDENGTPLSNVTVCANFVNGNGYGACGDTDNNGYFNGKMPASEELFFSIKLGDCSFDIGSVYGPFTSNTNLGVINASNPDIEIVEISGNIIDCSGNPLTNGFVKFTLGNQTTFQYLNDESEISFSMANCDEATGLLVTGINMNDFQQSDPLTFPVSSSIDLGEIVACGNGLDEYFILTINGDSRTFPFISHDNDAQAEPGATWILVEDTNQDFLIYGFNGNKVGVYDDDGIDIFYGSVTFPNLGVLDQECGGVPCGPTELIITEYGQIGEKIKGTFSGIATFINNSGPNLEDASYSGSFEFYREF